MPLIVNEANALAHWVLSKELNQLRRSVESDAEKITVLFDTFVKEVKSDTNKIMALFETLAKEVDLAPQDRDTESFSGSDDASE